MSDYQNSCTYFVWANAFKSGSRVWVNAKILDQLLYQNYAAVMEPCIIVLQLFWLAAGCSLYSFTEVR